MVQIRKVINSPMINDISGKDTRYLVDYYGISTWRTNAIRKKKDMRKLQTFQGLEAKGDVEEAQQLSLKLH